MGKYTIVKSVKPCFWNENSRDLEIIYPEKGIIIVESYENGIATLEPMVGAGIEKLATIIVGAFEIESNVSKILMIEYGSKFPLWRIDFSLNLVPISVTPNEASIRKICEMWRDGLNEMLKTK